MFLSICIPTYNRIHCLNNCLNAIYISKKNFDHEFEVCISDNCSTEDVEKVVNLYKDKINIKFKKNKENIGLGKNILEAVSMAKGDYAWILGNDDFILPNTLEKFYQLVNSNSEVDYFFINNYELNSKYVFSCKQPFDTNNLPSNMKKWSKLNSSKNLKFFEIIKPDISWDFLMGMFLSVFRRKKWVENSHVIDQKLISDKKLFSNVDNTYPHVKIFAHAFSKSKAYYQADPLLIALRGEREWDYLYDYIEIIRIPEVLDLYRKMGMPLFQYLYCKNYALRNFASYLIKILFYKGETGLKYINFKKHIFNNLFFPNVYLSFFYFIFRKISKFTLLNKK